MAKEKKKHGRPRSFDDEKKQYAVRCAENGMDHEQISNIIGVNRSTFQREMDRDDSFRDAIHNAKERADEEMVNSLRFQAKGGSRLVKKSVYCEITKKVKHIEVYEYHKPSTHATTFWLKNRNPERWREKQEHNVQIDSFEFVGDDG